jgi:hypothetical protein
MNGTVTDRFEIKGRSALEYGAAGVVVIFRNDPSAVPPAAGESVLLVRQDGWLYTGKAEDVRFEPSTASCGVFLRGLHGDDVPLGSLIRWGSEVHALQTAVA